MDYVTIDIEITSSTIGSGFYKVNASIKGIPDTFRYERTASEEISINLQEWKNLNSVLLSLNAHVRSIYDKEEIQVKAFGKSLFQQVIKGAVYTLYRNGKDYSGNSGHALRLRLHLGLSELIELPWELLCEEGNFLCLTAARPRMLITRCPIGIEPTKSIEHHLPLQIMLITAEPKDRVADVKWEKELIKKALKGVVAEGFVSLKEMQGTDTELENIYLNKALDIFHFIGHGSFNKVTQEGELILEDGLGNARTIPAYRFSMSLPNSVRLIFLNACESARGNAQDPFSSIAYILAKQGRVVIAMQFQISSSAAARFAKIFYSEIASGKPVDEAVAEARQRVFTMADCNPFDWAAPVLYMKSNTGVLFDIKDPSLSSVTLDDEGKLVASMEESPVKTEELSSVSSSRRGVDQSLKVESGKEPLRPISPVAPSWSRRFSRLFRSLNNYRRRHPRSSTLIVTICVVLLLAPVLKGLFFPSSTSSTITTSCNGNSVLYPHLDNSESELNTFVNTPGMVDTEKDADGNVIGLSAGSTILDTTNAGSNLAQEAATALRGGDGSSASSNFVLAVARAPLNAEARIYEEDLRVLSHKLNYIAVVLGLDLTSGRYGGSRDNMQGAYLAQVAYNQSAPQKNCPSLVLIIANSGADAANATLVSQKILELKKANPHLVGVVGWTISASSVNANSQLAHQPRDNDNVFMLSPSSSSKVLSGYPNFLRIVPSDVDQAQIMASYSYEKLNYRKIALLYSSANYSSSLYASFKDAFTKRDGTSVVSEQPYSPGDMSSLGTALSNVLQSQSKPDGIYFAGYASDAGFLLSSPQIASLPSGFKILGGDGLAILSDYPANPQNLDRLVFTSFASQDEWRFLLGKQVPWISTFIKNYDSAFGGQAINTSVMLAYDAVNVFLQGYRMALANGGTSTCLPCALQKALQSMNGPLAWQGVSGQIAFDSSSTEPLDKVILISTIENGAIKTIDYRGCFLVDRTDCRR